MKALAFALALVLASPSCAQAQTEDQLFAWYEEVVQGSRTFAHAMAAVQADRTVSLGFTAQALEPNEVGRTDLLAGSGHRRAVVRFDLEQGYRAGLTEDEWKTVIVHEVYGHAIPFLTSGKVCGDPALAQDYQDSCVGRREAAVLRELDIRTRRLYGIRD